LECFAFFSITLQFALLSLLDRSSTFQGDFFPRLSPPRPPIGQRSDSSAPLLCLIRVGRVSRFSIVNFTPIRLFRKLVFYILFICARREFPPSSVPPCQICSRPYVALSPTTLLRFFLNSSVRAPGFFHFVCRCALIDNLTPCLCCSA